MAIKGKAYTKTTWAFQERPVASSKLNLWDDRIENALEQVYFLLNLAWGGGNGVLRGTADGELEVIPTNPHSLRVRIQPGWAFISNTPFRLRAAVDSAALSPPSQLPRKDLVQANLETWDISIKTGVEASAPICPTPDHDSIPLAQVYLRPGMGVIRQQDDLTNGYIIDARTFI